MSLKKTLILNSVILFFLLNQSLFSSEVQSENFLLKNELSMNEQGDYIVDITLVNQSGRDVQIFIGSLPWAKNDFLIESIIIGGSKAALYTNLISYSSNYVDLKSKGKLTGKINLSDSLSETDAAMLSLKEFMVFWRYKLILIDGKSLGERSGMIQK